MTFEEFKKKAETTGIKFELFTDTGFLDGFFAEIPSACRYVGLACRPDGTNISVKYGLPWEGKSELRFYDSFEQVRDDYRRQCPWQ